MDGKLRFGVCGLGFMGAAHLARLREQPHAEVVAVCDRDPARLAGAGSAAAGGNLDALRAKADESPLAGVRKYAAPDELIADPHVDAVLIALPTRLHAPVAVAALRAGKQVLCEKPMAFNPGECGQMIEASRAADRTLMVAQCIRFWPQYETIHRYLDEGRLGAIRYLSLRRLGSPPGYSAGNWLLDGAQSGGAQLDLLVHDIDFAHWLLGIPQTITAIGSIGVSGELDHVVATYQYRDGPYALIEGGWALAAPRPFGMAVLVNGERGTLEWDSLRGDDVLYYHGQPEPESIPCSGDALWSEQAYFIDCVLAGRPVERCSPVSTRISITLAWLQRRAVELGRPVHVTDRLQQAWSR